MGVVAAGVHGAIAAQHQGAVEPLDATVLCDLHHGFASDRVAGIGAHVDRHRLVGRVAGTELAIAIEPPTPELAVLVDAVAIGVVAVIELICPREARWERRACRVGAREGGAVPQLEIDVAPPGPDTAIGHDQTELAVTVGLRVAGVFWQLQRLGAGTHIRHCPDRHTLRADGEHLPGLTCGQGDQLVAIEVDDLARQIRDPLRALGKQIPCPRVGVRRHARGGVRETHKAVAVVADHVLAGVGGAGVIRAAPGKGNLAQRNGSHEQSLKSGD